MRSENERSASPNRFPGKATGLKRALGAARKRDRSKDSAADFVVVAQAVSSSFRRVGKVPC